MGMLRSRQARDRWDLLQRPGDVAGPGKNNQGRVLIERSDDLARIPPAAWVAGDGHELAAATVAQVSQRKAYGVVFKPAGDNATSGFRQSVDGDVQRFGGVHAKTHALGAVRAEQLGERFPGAINDGGGFERAAVRAAPARATHLARERVHREIDHLGLGKAGGSVVEVDGLPHLAGRLCPLLLLGSVLDCLLWCHVLPSCPQARTVPASAKRGLC